MCKLVPSSTPDRLRWETTVLQTLQPPAIFVYYKNRLLPPCLDQSMTRLTFESLYIMCLFHMFSHLLTYICYEWTTVVESFRKWWTGWVQRSSFMDQWLMDQVTQGKLHMVIEAFVPGQWPTQLSTPAYWPLATQHTLSWSLDYLHLTGCVRRAADFQRGEFVQLLSLPAWRVSGYFHLLNVLLFIALRFVAPPQ